MPGIIQVCTCHISSKSAATWSLLALQVSDPHEPVSPVATHLLIFPDRGTLSPVLPVTDSHGRAQRVVPGFISHWHPQGIFRRLKGWMQEHAAGFCSLRAAVPWISPYPHLWTSKSSGNDLSDRPGYDSDGEGSVACSHASEMPYTPDSWKRALPKQIRGKAWVFHGIITTDADWLHPESWSTACPHKRPFEHFQL